MGRPLNKKLFGANAKTNIKVQFYNGAASVPGFIVKQKGAKRFVCQDASGNRATCRLTNAAAAALTAGQMSISVKLDDTTVAQVTKIAARRLTVNGVSIPWNFSTSTTDNKVEIEEAGTDTSLTGATDLEGDD